MRVVGNHSKFHYEREPVELSVWAKQRKLPTELERLSQRWRDRQLAQLSVLLFTTYEKYGGHRGDSMSYREPRHHRQKKDLIIKLETLSLLTGQIGGTR